MEAPEIHSAALNTTFKGVATSENVIQFRNIKFASIPRRFARSQLVEAYEGVVVDATAHGCALFRQARIKIDLTCTVQTRQPAKYLRA